MDNVICNSNSVRGEVFNNRHLLKFVVLKLGATVIRVEVSSLRAINPKALILQKWKTFQLTKQFVCIESLSKQTKDKI